MIKYWAGPWQWKSNGVITSYCVPDNSFAMVDLRTIEQQSAQNHSNGVGNGIFCTDDSVDLGSDYTLLGIGTHITETLPETGAKSAWQSLFGVNPQGTYLVDYLAYTLTDGADPEGLTAVKPIIPSVYPIGETSIWLAGHSKIWSKIINVRGGTGNHEKSVRKILQNDLQKIADGDKDLELWRKVLGKQKEKYGQAWDDPGENYLLPLGLKNRSNGRGNSKGKAEKPATTYTESWPSNGAITSGQDRTWEFLTGGEPAYLEVSSNQLRHTGAGAGWTLARITSALSSADHYAELEYKSRTGTFDALSGIARKDSTNSTLTYYLTHWYGETPTPTAQSYKRVSGTYTFLASSSSGALTSGDKIKIEINGSTLKGYVAGVEKTSVTDTSISSNTYTGVALLAQSSQQIYTDNWTGADLGGAVANRKRSILLLNCGKK